MTRQAGLDLQIGAALREARLAQGFTQEELAQALGVNRTTITRYERGRRSLPVSVLPRLVKLLAVPISALVPGQPLPPETRQPAMMTTPERAAMETLLRVLEQQPDLLPAVLETIEQQLQQAGHRQAVGSG